MVLGPEPRGESAMGASDRARGAAGITQTLVLRREEDGTFPAPRTTRLVVHAATVHAAEIDGEQAPVVADPSGGWAVECHGGFQLATFEVDLSEGRT